MKDWKISVDRVIHLLPEDIRIKGETMAEAYAYLYVLENILRIFVDSNLEKAFGNQYFQTVASLDMKKAYSIRKTEEQKNKWISLRGNTSLFYLDFNSIGDLIISQWSIFKPFFPDQHWVKSKMDELSKCRNLIAHNSFLGEQENILIRLYFEQFLSQINISENLITSQRVNEKFDETNCFIKGTKRSTVFSLKEVESGGEYLLSYPAYLDVKPLFLRFLSEQVGIFFKIYFENAMIYLPTSFDIGIDSKEEGERIFKSNVIFQIGQYDFDDDGIEEIIIAVMDNDLGDNGIQMNIFKYYPPVFIDHSNRTQNWKLIGNLKGQMILGEPIAYLKEKSVSIPRNLRGYYYGWDWLKGHFIDTGFT